ncbi:DUF1778 domain-containing protein [Bosea sp. (in: a-proteobacteria)]|jgi:uncharacterized protein (DUF1778 family)|uniref:type II toxin-antitoxin system TacA family antitoxin n=1 Tax=Bosea sp. (in: a-proteobacteria) TaxID=1871050 RepID=UPI003564A30C
MKTQAVARLEARLPAELHAMLKRAAELQGRSLTDFVVGAARDAAQRAIEDASIMRLSAADQKRFADALFAPPAAGAELKDAAALWAEHVEVR